MTPAAESEVEIAIIGSGRAALAATWFLRGAGLSLAILDAGKGPAGAWRPDWDSLRPDSVETALQEPQ